MERRRFDDRWVVDKKIPLALILTTTVQLGVAVWWLSDLNTRVRALEKFAQSSMEETKDHADDESIIKDRILKLEINLNNIDSTLHEIKELLAAHSKAYTKK